MDLMWILGVRHKGENKASIGIAYIPHACVFEFLEGEQGDAKTLMEWNIHKKLASQKDIKNPSIKKHQGHIWYKMTFLFYYFDMYFLNTYDSYCSYVL
jgi:hypothetical protein